MPKGKALAPLDKNVCVQSKDKPSAAKGEVLVFSCTTITRAPARGKITVATLWSGVRAKDMGKTRNDGLARLVRAQASRTTEAWALRAKGETLLPSYTCMHASARCSTKHHKADGEAARPLAGSGMLQLLTNRSVDKV
jgi:hypothetical protein